MPTWTTACPDWEARFAVGRSLLPCGPLFPDYAAKAMEVFESLLAVDVQNPTGAVDPETGLAIPPTYGQISRAWLLDLAAVILGSYDEETGQRLIREVLLKVPKKNWKSGFAAGVMLTLMILNWRSSNGAAIIAPTKDTADNCFTPMRVAIENDPELAAIFHIQPINRTITHRVTKMSCRVYAADTDAISGKKWAFVIFEELWLLAKRRGASDMMLEATGGQASRPEGVVISITTESDEEPVGEYKAKVEFARRVRDGEIDAPWFLPVLYEWPKAMIKSKAYLDLANAHLINPNYGASVDPDDLARKMGEAMEAGGEKLRVFLAKRLNVPPSENMGGGWVGADYWLQQADRTLTLERMIEHADAITVGIDGGGMDDLLGLAFCGRHKHSKRKMLIAYALAHPKAVERRKGEAERYDGFVKDGHMFIGQDADGEATDLADMARMIKRVQNARLLSGIGIDPSGTGTVLDALAAEKIDQTLIVGIRQGWQLTGTCKTFERWLADGVLSHDGSALLAWCVSNAKVEASKNALYVTKAASGVGKIDPLMAAMNAVELMSRNPEPKNKKLVLMTVGGSR